MGFGAVPSDRKDDLFSWNKVLPEDLVKYGFLPEFIGRLPVIVGLEELSESDLIRVLSEPKDSICRQYQELFREDGVNLRFTRDALEEIAHRAIERKCGARGLKAIMEEYAAAAYPLQVPYLYRLFIFYHHSDFSVPILCPTVQFGPATDSSGIP